MSRRIEENVVRPPPSTIVVNGKAVTAYEGESLLTALLSSGHLVLSRGPSGTGRGPFCNMGVCFDCLVTVEEPTGAPDSQAGRVRACLAEVQEGLRVTVAKESEHRHVE